MFIEIKYVTEEVKIRMVMIASIVTLDFTEKTHRDYKQKSEVVCMYISKRNLLFTRDQALLAFPTTYAAPLCSSITLIKLDLKSKSCVI
jgi:hypothetical protein